jgi:hypothetical protein
MFHCIPFIVGAAAGAVFAFVSTDQRTRDTLKDGADKLVDGAKRGVRKAAKAVVRVTSDPVVGDDQERGVSPTAH